MHLVVIHSSTEETTKLAEAISSALGITVLDARQRMIGGGPAVVASFADPQQAHALSEKLNQKGIATMVIDATEVFGSADYFIVRRFELSESSLRVETKDRQREEVSYGEIELLLPGMNIVSYSEKRTVTERKLSIGRTVLAGGIPLSKKVEHEEEVTAEERGRVLYVYVGKRTRIVFRQNAMSYDGLGAAMKVSRQLNFTHLISELRRLSPGAVFDDRLLTRAGQVRLLGSALTPETNLDLAAEILAMSLRPSSNRNNPIVP